MKSGLLRLASTVLYKLYFPVLGPLFKF